MSGDSLLQEKLERIDQELQELSAKQLKLAKEHNRSSFYRCWSKVLSGPADPELVALSDRIADLKLQRAQYFEIFQKAVTPSASPSIVTKRDSLLFICVEIMEL